MMKSLLLNPQIFGFEHLIYLAVNAIVLIAVVFVTIKFIKTDKQKSIWLKIFALLLLVTIIVNRIIISINSNYWAYIFPNSYCGLTSLLLSLFVLFGKPNLKAYHFLFYMGMVGGIITLIYPDFIVYNPSIFYPAHITGLLHHSFSIILSLLLLLTKWFTPNFKAWKYFPFGFGCYVIYGLALIDIFKIGDAMDIKYSILAGTPINWLFLMVVGSALLFVFLLVMELIKKHLNKKKNETQQ